MDEDGGYVGPPGMVDVWPDMNVHYYYFVVWPDMNVYYYLPTWGVAPLAHLCGSEAEALHLLAAAGHGLEGDQVPHTQGQHLGLRESRGRGGREGDKESAGDRFDGRNVLSSEYGTTEGPPH